MIKHSLFSLLIVLSSFAFAQKGTVKGKITGKAAANLKEIVMYYDGRTHRIPVDSVTFKFEGETTLKEAQFIEIKNGSTVSTFIYAVPEENFEIFIEKPTTADAKVTLGEGKIKRLNKPMETFLGVISGTGLSTTTRNWQEELFFRQDLVEKALSEAQKALNDDMKFLKSFAPNFIVDFEIFAKAFPRYTNLENLSLTQVEAILLELSTSEMKLTALTIPYFREFLVDLTNTYAARKIERYKLVIEKTTMGYVPNTIAAEACVQYIPNKSVINYLFFDKLGAELPINGLKNRAYVDFLLANVSQSVIKNFQPTLDKLYANEKPAAKENNQATEENKRIPAFNFTLVDTLGKTYTLDEFKGKMIYIDLWASWCGPCKGQAPYFKELEEHYKGYDIVFAKISLDASKPAWLNSVRKDKMEGVILLAEGAFKNPFPQHYGVSSIPRFMLIDADGNMIDDDAPRPQEKKKIMAMIDADLFKKQISIIMNKHFDAIGVSLLKQGKALRTKTNFNVMGIETEVEMFYAYPKKMRVNNLAVPNPTYYDLLGEDFYKPKSFGMVDTIISGNIAKINSAEENWIEKIAGLQLFLLAEVDSANFELAEENFTNKENQFVIKATYGNNKLQKFYIDKSTYLLTKIVETIYLEARKGGGNMEAITRFDDYRDVSGLKIPFTYSVNNILGYKVLDAEIKEIQDDIFIIK